MAEVRTIQTFGGAAPSGRVGQDADLTDELVQLSRSGSNAFLEAVLCPAWVHSDWQSSGLRVPRIADGNPGTRWGERVFDSSAFDSSRVDALLAEECPV